MFSNRIKLIASYIDENDKVLDVGTDHALLPIYLVKNNITNLADGSDISEKVLDSAKRNVEEFGYKDIISLFLSDGLKNICVEKYNTLVVAGMGYSTIKNILQSNKIDTINKLILQSNNHVEDLRRFLNQINYKIISEDCLKDKFINYTLIVAEKGHQELSEEEYICGIYNSKNKWFYQESLEKIKNIKDAIKNNDSKIEELNYKLSIYKDYVSR